MSELIDHLAKIEALLEEVRDRIPDPKPAVTMRIGRDEFPAKVSPALDEDGTPPALIGDPKGLDWIVLPGEPVEPSDLRAGDKVEYTWDGTKAEKAERFRPEIDGENRVMDKAATVHRDASRRLRALLNPTGGENR